jgi:predicted HicB family RNase H-like nuclease
MPKTDEAWTQLATRIPKPLHRELKLHCVQAETSVMEFVIAAIEDKLGRKAKPKKRKA